MKLIVEFPVRYGPVARFLVELPDFHGIAVFVQELECFGHFQPIGIPLFDFAEALASVASTPDSARQSLTASFRRLQNLDERKIQVICNCVHLDRGISGLGICFFSRISFRMISDMPYVQHTLGGCRQIIVIASVSPMTTPGGLKAGGHCKINTGLASF